MKDLTLDKAKAYAHQAYALARKFPRDETYGLGSQLRRASVSVPLNMVEGYARQSARTQLQFLKIAYGSLKESLFIIQFAYEETYVAAEEALPVIHLGDETARMLWTKIQILQKHLKL